MTINNEYRHRLDLATKRFRSAIERCDRQELPECFAEFPRGCCGDAALLLAQFLSDEDFGRFRYVCGKRQRSGEDQAHTHAWLRQGELIVDITADQFPEMSEAVVVTAKSEFYDSFELEDEHDADLGLYDEHTASVLRSAYGLIRASIETA